VSSLTTRDDSAGSAGHAWWPRIDHANECHVWRCTCGHLIYQLFGAPVPDELIGHPQSHGQMRGEK